MTRSFLAALLIVALIVPSPAAAQEMVATDSARTATPSATFDLPLSASESSVTVALPTPIVAAPSARIRQPSRLRRLAKRHFLARESVVLVVENDGGDDAVTLRTDGPKGEVTLPVSRTRNNEGMTLTVSPPSEFVPGKYTVTLTDSLGAVMTEEFLWGVLAINTNKSIYTKDEDAHIAIAVLDDMGRMVCDAEVRLEITNPSTEKTVLSTTENTILVNEQCKKRDVSLTPDYEALYRVAGVGTYALQLSVAGRSGEYSITDQFEVRESVPLVVERRSATRIYPPHTYPVEIEITANQDFTGVVTETVPESFIVTPFEGVVPYTNTRIGHDSKSVARDVVHIKYPFNNKYAETLGFGQDVKDPYLVEQYQRFGLIGHDGVDFALPEGTPVLAADSGRVALSGEGAYGTTVVLQHSWGRSYYGHLSQTLVSKGDTVKTGDRIGLSGQTGLATGPHLHFGIRPRTKNMHNGYYGKIDPLPNLAATASEMNTPHQYISWNLALKKGEKISIGYQYKTPLASPALYRTGPLRFRDGKDERVLGEATGSASFWVDEEAATPSAETIQPFVSSDIAVFEEARQWQIAADAVFQMQTGYYIGTGTDNFAISGVGFQPELVVIKDDTANGNDGVNFKTSAMSGEVSSVLGDADADTSSDAIQSLDSDGFTLGTDADVNAANIRFTWIAFRGSDCTSSGTFCVGSYTGDGQTTQSITSVGFASNFVAVKRSGASAGVFRTSSMGTNVSQSFADVNETTDGTVFTTLDSTGFTVGNAAAVNSASTPYWFIAFKTTSGAFAQGTFTGDGLDGKAITVGFAPDAVWIKNANATVAAPAGLSQTESDGDYTSQFTDVGNQTGWIKLLDSNGFTAGTAAGANENTKTIYWVAFAGSVDPTASGTYTMKVGSYTGNGTSQSITGVGFAPDLVIIKDESGVNYTVYRTRLMKGDTTSYISTSTANFSGGITSLDSGGFTLGADVTVNTNGTVYHYQAFGNAFNPENNTGSADFSLGAYTGSGTDNRDIVRNPFQPDLVVVRRNTAHKAMWRTSAQSGDVSFSFFADAEAADDIQAINSDGFEVGTQLRVNGAGQVVWFFAFKSGTTMAVGSYTGSASAQDITGPGFQPDLVWVKNSMAVKGVYRPSTITGDSTQYFSNNAAVSDRITAFISTGFSVGGNWTDTNTSGTTYRYAVWKTPATGPTNDQLLRHGNWFSSGGEQSFTF